LKTQLGHIQFNIDAANLGFYKDLFGFLGWTTLHEGEGYIGIGDGGSCSLWVMGGANGSTYDHDGPGLNHLGISTETQADVDTAVEYLRGKGVELLYGTPCHRPEYSDETSTYYSAMFESPDKILLEVVYSGPKSA
jgi:catechol 2,3-dioxygenase-like lactoylglutathione lyase family enzyme